MVVTAVSQSIPVSQSWFTFGEMDPCSCEFLLGSIGSVKALDMGCVLRVGPYMICHFS